MVEIQTKHNYVNRTSCAYKYITKYWNITQLSVARWLLVKSFQHDFIILYTSIANLTITGFTRESQVKCIGRYIPYRLEMAL